MATFQKQIYILINITTTELSLKEVRGQAKEIKWEMESYKGGV